MYCIYTIIYGVKIPDELNERIQGCNLELKLFEYNPTIKELMRTQEDKQFPFILNVPYAGSGLADTHLGINMGCTDGDH